MFFLKQRYVHNHQGHNTRAAEQVVPYVVNLLKPTSVVDVGCGTGTWLKVFQENGVKEIVGIEGPHLEKRMLVIEPSKVVINDLEQPFTLNRTFDLVVSLEVAEHLMETAADRFVESLVRLGKVILFSAAIPRQGGQNHINEQWPTYWQEKFKRHDYYFSDCLRQVFWENAAVDTFYKQNMFLVCHSSLEHIIPRTNTIFNIVHPAYFLKARRKLLRKRITYRG